MKITCHGAKARALKLATWLLKFTKLDSKPSLVVWLSVWLGLRSNISINSKSTGQAKTGRNPMVSIHDLIANGLLDKDHRCMERSCILYQLPREAKALTSFAIFDLCNGCRDAMNMRIDSPLDDLHRRWMERVEFTGDLHPIPKEIADRFDSIAVEVLMPDSAISVGIFGKERPSVELYKGSHPGVKYYIWHIREKFLGLFNWFHKLF